MTWLVGSRKTSIYSADWYISLQKSIFQPPRLLITLNYRIFWSRRTKVALEKMLAPSSRPTKVNKEPFRKNFVLIPTNFGFAQCCCCLHSLSRFLSTCSQTSGKFKLEAVNNRNKPEEGRFLTDASGKTRKNSSLAFLSITKSNLGSINNKTFRTKNFGEGRGWFPSFIFRDDTFPPI